MDRLPGKYFTAKSPIIFGILTIITLIVTFGYWAFGTQISGAIITSGLVGNTSKTVIIQNAEGGEIIEIFVEENQEVENGQILLKLNSDELVTDYAIVRDQLAELLAKRARLEGQIDGSIDLDFSELLSLNDKKKFASLISAQKQIFESQKEIILKKIEQLGSKSKQISSLIEGLSNQKIFLREEVKLVDERLALQEKLFEKNLSRTGQVVDLKRNLTQLRSKIAAISAEIAKNASSKNEIELEILELNAQAQQEALRELREQQIREMELKERFARLKVKISKRLITAPVNGKIFGLMFFNPGTVVRPAEKIMGIVPDGSNFMIEANLLSAEIDQVYIGQPVRLSFPSLERTKQVDLHSRVENISADAFLDERSGQNYFKATIMLSDRELGKLPSNFQIRPGMLTEVYFLRSDRRVISYLTDPIVGFFEKAFRE
jgi:HlyD family type I secretion membrane fusion protein